MRTSIVLVGVWLGFSFGSPAPCAAQDSAAPAQAIRVGADEEATLRVWNRDIATFRATLGERTPEDRVETAAGKIQDLSYGELSKQVTVLPARIGRLEGMAIMLDTNLVFALVPEDLDPLANEVLPTVAAEAADRLKTVLTARAEQQQLPVLVRGVGKSLLATMVFALVIWVVLASRRRLLHRLTHSPIHLSGMRLFEIELGPYLLEIQAYLVRATAVVIGLTAAYLWLTFLFSQFPYSEPWGVSLGRLFYSIARTIGGGIVAAAPGMTMVAIILLLTRFLIRLVGGLLGGIERGIVSVSWLNPETARATRRLVTILLWAFALTVAYPYIPGSNSDAFKGISVLVGLMISLGSTGVVNQVMSGLVVVYSRAVQPGEYVRFGQIEGTVSEVGLLSTRIITPRREEINIPNSLLVADATTNYSRLAAAGGAIATTSVTIGYDTPWRQVHAMLIEAAARTEGVRQDPAPTVRQQALSDFYVEYQLFVRLARPEARPAVLSDLHANIQDVFNGYGVQIMSPHFVAQPAAPVVVPPEQWHTAPAPSDSKEAESPTAAAAAAEPNAP